MGSLLNMSSGALVKMPYDAEIEYLESSGTQFLRINVAVDRSATLYVKGFVSSNNHELYSFDDRYQYQLNMESTRIYYRWWTSSSLIVQTSNMSVPHSYKCNSSLYIDGEYIKTIEPSLDNTTKYISLLGGSHGISAGRIYNASIVFNNTIILDIIPVRIGTTGYMYDKVTKQLFGNAGTGSFILGPDKH